MLIEAELCNEASLSKAKAVVKSRCYMDRKRKLNASTTPDSSRQPISGSKLLLPSPPVPPTATSCFIPVTRTDHCHLSHLRRNKMFHTGLRCQPATVTSPTLTATRSLTPVTPTCHRKLLFHLYPINISHTCGCQSATLTATKSPTYL